VKSLSVLIAYRLEGVLEIVANFSRYLTPTPYKERIPYKVIFIDTETSAIDIDEKTEKLSLLVACYEVWIVNDVGMPIAMETKGDIYNESEFYRLLKEHLPCRVVAHNWRFDATVLRIGAKDNLNKWGYDIDVSNSIIPVVAQGFTPFVISLDFDGLEAELICNTNFYKQSLASLGDSFTTAKLPIPQPQDYDLYTDYLTDLTTYCARDVEVLRKSWFFLFEFTQEIGDVTPAQTIAMSANRVYRNRYMPTDMKVQGTLGIPYISDIEQEAYKGGRTDAFFRGNPEVDIFKYDVNSLYPFSMLGDIPIRYVQRCPVNMLIDCLETGESRFTYLAEVTIHIPEDARHAFIGGEGIKTEKGELIFPIGVYKCWIWYPMLELLYHHGYIKEIHTCYAYNKHNIFDDYVLSLYSLREEYKKSGDSARDLLVKILLNSLYGKFGQREHIGWELADEYERDVMLREATGVERFDEVYDDEFVEYLQVGDTLYRALIHDDTSPSANSVMSIAGYITTMARSILWSAMAQILDSGGNIYYCDTDSIFSSIQLPDSMVSQTELGKWKLEEIIPKGEAEFIAPKHYRISDKWTIKGVRNPSNSNRHNQVIFPNFITDLTSKNMLRRSRLDSGAVITRIVKEPTGINGKRISSGDNAPTYPLLMA